MLLCFVLFFEEYINKVFSEVDYCQVQYLVLHQIRRIQLKLFFCSNIDEKAGFEVSISYKSCIYYVLQ